MDSPGRDPLRRLVAEFGDPVEAFGDHRLSKLGDALLNFIYSLSLSVHGGVPEGKKIPNSVLAKAVESSRYRGIVPKRSDRHRKGDLVEAIFSSRLGPPRSSLRTDTRPVVARLILRLTRLPSPS